MTRASVRRRYGPPNRGRASELGASLVETLLCMLLISVAVMALARLSVHSTAVVDRSGRSTEGLTLAAAMLDALQALPSGSVHLREGGDTERAASDGESRWFADVGRYRVLWSVRRFGSVPALLGLEIVVRGHGVSSNRVFARLRGTRPA